MLPPFDCAATAASPSPATIRLSMNCITAQLSIEIAAGQACDQTSRMSARVASMGGG